MGSGEQRFGLAGILRHAYDEVQEEEEEECPQGAKSLTELEKSLGPTQGSEMPLGELLALYGYEVSDPILEHSGQPSEPPASLPDMTLDKDQIAKDLLSGEEEDEAPSSADDLTPSVTSHTSDLFRPRLRDGERDSTGSGSDEDSEGTSLQSSDGSKEIMVGPQYQALIPPLSAYSHQDRAYENEDQLLWTPGRLTGEAVEEFLLKAQRRGGEEGVADTPTSGDIIKDNEQALYELVKCNFNAEEALRRLHFNIKVFSEELCAWSEEECRNFEHGYRVHGKNFHLIQANKVRTRSVGECVGYYYLWKKSDRHEYFTQQTTRLGRKKSSLQSEPMEDGEQDAEGAELEEGCSHSHGFPCGASPTMPQDAPPSPPDLFHLDKPAAASPGSGAGAELGGAASSLPPHPSPTAPQAPPVKQRPPPPAREDHREPVTNCPEGPRCPRPVTAPGAQLRPSQGPPSGPAGPQLLGPGFYRLQLGPFLADGAPGAPEHEVSATSEFGALSSFLRPPVPPTRPLTQ
ncbi:mesoderm induction early response protein 2 [Anguilla rostrata]|uniref:mesoderm induction early response protein 2 n=1 Tax=Anguilla rostrata TaxID=7938 RepID=UPI0030CB23BF